jgi:hypothetical protein
MSSLSELEVDELASILNIDSEQTAVIVSSLTLLLAVISSRKESESEIVDALLSAGLIGPSEKAPLESFIRMVIARRSEVKRTITLSRLAEQTIPSFSGINTSVDLRIGFRKEKVDIVVPVALIHLHTDSDKEKIFFQMQKTDVQRLIREFQRVLDRMEEVETWSAERAKSIT